jgi:tryptophan synthase alpha subunit
MRALSIRQPYAELILRGIKTAELRSRSTRIVGERFYIYAAKGRGQRSETGGQKGAFPADLRHLTSDNLSVQSPPAWMIELAEQVKMIEEGAMLPTGVIVGSAVIERVSRADDVYRWHLAGVERARTLRKPTGRPQPVWFNPF